MIIQDKLYLKGAVTLRGVGIVLKMLLITTQSRFVISKHVVCSTVQSRVDFCTRGVAGVNLI